MKKYTNALLIPSLSRCGVFTSNGCFSVHLPQHKGVQPPLYLNRQNAAVSADTQNKSVKEKAKIQDSGRKIKFSERQT